MNMWIAVTDDEAVSESLRTAVPVHDLLYVEARTEDALRRLISIRPDAIIVDDSAALGNSAIRRLHEHSPGIPILALSARPHRDVHAAHILAGAAETVDKPFDCDALLETLRGLKSSHPQPTSFVSPTRIDSTPGADVSRHQMALRWLTRAAGQLDEPIDLTRRLCDTAIDIFDAVRGAVVLHVDGRARIVAEHGIAADLSGRLNLDYQHGLLRRFELEPTLVDRHLPGLDDEAIREMEAIGARIAVPIVVSGQTCGALLLGEKANGSSYNGEERNLISLMARGAAACLEQAQYRRETARHQERLDTVLKHITAGVVTIDRQKHITLLNTSGERILNIASEEIVGRSVQKLGSTFADLVIRTMNDGQPRLRSTIFDTAIQSHLGVSVTPLGDEGVVAIFTQLEESPRKEDPAFSPIWQYLSSRIAQEIKNPMVAINTFAQLLPEKYKSPEFREEFAGIVQQEVSRINDVVETLYEFARNPRLNLNEADLNEHVKECLHRFDDAMGRRGIEVEYDLSNADLKVELDEELFDQALCSVVQNSIDSMPDGGQIKIKTRRENGGCEIEVADTGCGISEQDAPHIFTPFFSTKEKGMGLGLTLARRIVQEHNGSLQPAPPSDIGSSFLFQIPFRAPEEPKH